jgi:two-component system sensor histidine kinase KdpD
VRIAVLDRGLGIPVEELDNVFDKFYRLRHSQGASGIGLGLSICKGIIEAHGGQISANQRPGGGAVFAIILPAQAASAEPRKEAKHE